jgi:hypothetical protein
VAGSTKTGAYTLNGDTTSYLETRNTGASYFLPSENEWYKAALYKGGSTNAGYWAFATQSDTPPSNVLSATGTNNANDPGPSLADPTNFLTPVGSFASSPSYYGTFDQEGDVYQWNDAAYGGSQRGLSGDAWEYSQGIVGYWNSLGLDPTRQNRDVGFRVASTPEPGDANGDGKVDINDLTIVLANYGQTGCAWSQGCMDGDPTGTVDVNDLTIVLANYGTTYGASSAVKAVPEPSTITVLLAGAACLLAFAWRRRTA